MGKKTRQAFFISFQNPVVRLSVRIQGLSQHQADQADQVDQTEQADKADQADQADQTEQPDKADLSFLKRN